jgi:dipeptidyl aminopeptidase/acylaminoacyl peptidase
MKLLRTLLVLSLAWAIATAAEKRPLAPQDLWAIKRVGAPALSPDGRQVVFTVQEWSVEKNKSTTNLWLVPVSGGEPRRLTTANTADTAPTWSPDGTRIAFLSKRGDDENNALYVLPRGGVEEGRGSRAGNLGPDHCIPRGGVAAGGETEAEAGMAD